MSMYRDFMMPQVCQFMGILWCPKYVNLQTEVLMVHQVCQFIHTFYGAPSITIYRDFMMSQICQFTDILWSNPEFVNLHSLWCPKYVDLQRFCCALSMSVYRVFSSVIGQSFYQCICISAISSDVIYEFLWRLGEAINDGATIFISN